MFEPAFGIGLVQFNFLSALVHLLLNSTRGKLATAGDHPLVTPFLLSRSCVPPSLAHPHNCSHTLLFFQDKAFKLN
jgi:hypothetical protein